MGHLPVLLDEVVSRFNRPQTRVLVDGTLGGGGHAEALLTRIPGIERYIGLDRDDEAMDRCRQRLARFGERVQLHHESFHDLEPLLDRIGIGAVDGILLDLGMSSYQVDDAGRGFSFMSDGPLDMRMDRRQTVTAARLVNEAGERELVRILREYGEERMAPRIARELVRRRKEQPFGTTADLAGFVERLMGRRGRERGHHPATRTFQALRIAVNDELGPLEATLRGAIGRLTEGGRIAVITFHSLEDRIVKETFRDEVPRCRCPRSQPVCTCGEPGRVRLVTTRPVAPSPEEVAANSRARSAKLRVAERLAAADE